jgi:hypothetical protein
MIVESMDWFGNPDYVTSHIRKQREPLANGLKGIVDLIRQIQIGSIVTTEHHKSLQGGDLASQGNIAIARRLC